MNDNASITKTVQETVNAEVKIAIDQALAAHTKRVTDLEGTIKRLEDNIKALSARSPL